MGRTALGMRRAPVENTDMRTAAMPRHTDGLWNALAAAVCDADEDPTSSRRRLAALRLHRAFATAGDLD
jgi:hypothetical protein